MNNFKYDVEISVPASFSPDTNKPLYNKLIRLPDKESWATTLGRTSSAAYPYITEFIARKHAGYPMDSRGPFLKQEVGYSPFSTLPVFNMDENTINGFL